MGSVGRKPPSGEGTRCLAMLVAQIFLTLAVIIIEMFHTFSDRYQGYF